MESGGDHRFKGLEFTNNLGLVNSDILVTNNFVFFFIAIFKAYA